MSPSREYVSAPEMGIEVWVPTNVDRPPERYVSPSVRFVNVMSPLAGFVEPIRNTPPDLGRRTRDFKPSKKKIILPHRRKSRRPSRHLREKSPILTS